MGLTKQENFISTQNELAKLAKAFAHPARIAIVEHLIKSNACICGDLVNEINLAQSTISQHLKELKNAGIIKRTIEGTSVRYCIDPLKWKIANNIFKKLFDSFSVNNTCC